MLQKIQVETWKLRNIQDAIECYVSIKIYLESIRNNQVVT